MKSILIIVPFILLFSSIGHCTEVNAMGPLTIASQYQLNSTILKQHRQFYISLPKNYHLNQHHYPVLYLLDAEQNMQQAVASATMLSQWRGIPQLIIVGIPSRNRIHDFTPSPDENYSPQSGGGKLFMSFIKQELIPYIDKHYRTHPYRILFGHSLSGLLAANELTKGDDTFNAFIITAPALWWNHHAILRSIPSDLQHRQQPQKTAYLGIGKLDGYGMKQELQRFIDLLKNNADNIHLAHKVYPDEGHMSAPLSVTYDGLLFVFSDIPYHKSEWQHFTSQGFIQRESHLNAKYGSTAIQTAENYVALANDLLMHGNYSGAVTVLKANDKAYPDYAPNNELLANAYVLAGNIPKAIEQYQRAYNLTVKSTSGQGNAQKYRQQISLLSTPHTVSLQQRKAIVGCYASKEAKFYIYQQDGKLFGQRHGWTNFELFHQHHSQFFMRVPPGYHYQFVNDKKGKALEINAYGQLHRFPFIGNQCATI